MGNPRRFPRKMSNSVPDRKKKTRTKSSDSHVDSSTATRSKTSSHSSHVVDTRHHTGRLVLGDDDDVAEPERYDDGWARTFVAWLQTILAAFVVFSACFQYFWDGDMLIMCEFVMYQVCGLALLEHVKTNYYTGACCTFLVYQYLMTYVFFSYYLQFEFPDGSLFAKLLSVASIGCIGAVSHLAMMLHVVQLIGFSQKRPDHSAKIHVESKAKRRSGLYKLIAAIATEMCLREEDMRIDLKVADETGKTMRLSGANVEASLNRSTELRNNGDNVEIATSNSAEATIRIPAASKKQSAPAQPPLVQNVRVLNNSLYNNVSKQSEMLSARKLL